jgi:hypothetical protein
VAAEPVENVVMRVAELRSRGLYAEAAAELGRALRAGYDGGAEERLSFELGSILTHHIGDRARACRHWTAHLRRHGGGRYSREIALAEATAGCSDGRR